MMLALPDLEPNALTCNQQAWYSDLACCNLNINEWIGLAVVGWYSGWTVALNMLQHTVLNS